MKEIHKTEKQELTFSNTFKKTYGNDHQSSYMGQLF